MTDYRTPDALGITQAEFDGLTRLVKLFRRKAPTLVPTEDLSGVHPNAEQPMIEARLGFGMTYGTAIVDEPEVYNCGCAACIGGHLSLAMQGLDTTGTCFARAALDEADEYVRGNEYHPVLGKLFYPHVIREHDWKRITAEMAADAIENLLTEGSPLWHEVAEAHGLAVDSSYLP